MSKPPPQFIVPAEIDDAGLSLVQFRVLAHIVRRGNCTAAAGTIAKVCRIKRDTVFKALADLEDMGWIEREQRPGRSTLIQAVHPRTTRPPKRDTPEGGAAAEKGQHPSPKEGHHLPPQTGHKGYTIKEYHKGEAAAPPALAEQLINAHPRPSHNRAALEAAAAALRLDAFDVILAGVQTYAVAVSEWPEDERIAYTMTAAKFFDGLHWRTDKKDWESRRAAKKNLNGTRPELGLGRRKPAGVMDTESHKTQLDLDDHLEPNFDKPQPHHAMKK